MHLLAHCCQSWIQHGRLIFSLPHLGCRNFWIVTYNLASQMWLSFKIHLPPIYLSIIPSSCWITDSEDRIICLVHGNQNYARRNFEWVAILDFSNQFTIPFSHFLGSVLHAVGLFRLPVFINQVRLIIDLWISCPKYYHFSNNDVII